MSEMGGKIQEVRRRAGITRQEIARRLNIQYSHYLEIERGGVAPSGDVIHALAALLEVQPSEITGGASISEGVLPEAQAGTLGRLVLRQKALLELLLEKGVFEESEFEEAYRIAGHGN